MAGDEAKTAVLKTSTQARVPEYGAAGSSLSAEAWVDTVTGLATGAGWTDTSTAGHAYAQLVGRAAEWRRMMLATEEDRKVLTQWSTFKVAFLKRFGANRGTVTDTATLLNLQQKGNEDAGDFGDRCFNNILAVCSRVREELDEATQRQYFDKCRLHITQTMFLNGLTQPTRGMVNARNKECTDFHATVAIAMEVEDANRRETPAVAELQEQVAAIQPPYQARGRGRGRGRGGPQRGRGGPRGRGFSGSPGPGLNPGGSASPSTAFGQRRWIFCFRCRQWGKHYSRECTRTPAQLAALTAHDEEDPPEVDPAGLEEVPAEN